MKYNIWTDQEVEKLKQYLKEGLTNPEIGKKLNRNTRSVYRKINNTEGLEINKAWSQHKTKRLKELVEEGLTIKEIAKKLKMNYARVQKKIYRTEGLKCNETYKEKVTWNTKEDELLEYYISRNYTLDKAARLLNKTYHQVYSRKRKLGLEFPEKQEFRNIKNELKVGECYKIKYDKTHNNLEPVVGQVVKEYPDYYRLKCKNYYTSVNKPITKNEVVTQIDHY